MRMRLRGKYWLKLAAAVVAGGMLFQSATCSSTPADLGEQWATTVVDTWIVDYFNNQFNVAGGFF